jgi:PAS domain S-box-containing protein
MAFGLLDLREMPRFLKTILGTVAVLVAGATIGLAFLAFVRKVDTFTRLGLAGRTAGGAYVVASVEREGAAALAGLEPGDRIITADGRAAASIGEPDLALARKPFPHRLLVERAGEIREVLIGRVAARLDWTYLFLAFVGLLYLAIGLFTAARDRSEASRVFCAICLASFAIYAITPAGPHDAAWKAFLLTEDFYRALLPALLVHFFLVFPRRAASRAAVALLYVPGLAYLALQDGPLLVPLANPAAALVWAGRLWLVYFAAAAAAVLVRIAVLLRGRRARSAVAPADATAATDATDATAEKQIRWIGLGVTVGLAPFLLLYVLPRIFGLGSAFLSNVAVIPLALIPLAFAYAILRWRLWDVEIFVREAVATTAAVVLGGMAFVLLNALLDRTLEGMAEAGKNVIAFGSGLALASLLVPVKKRITDVLEKIQYHDTYRARRALLDVARDFSMPRPREELVRSIVQRVEAGLHVVPCSLFLLEENRSPATDALATRLADADLWRLRSTAFGDEMPDAARRLHESGYRSFFAMRCAGKLVGALGVGHKDGRVPLSTEDESLLVAVMAQAGLAYENARLYGALAERLEEIRALQQYQESVIRSSSSGIVVLDGEGRVHTANPAFGALVGRPEETLRGLRFEDVLPGVHLPVESAPETAATPAADDEERTVEARFRNAQGDERDVRVSVSAFHGAPDRRVVLVDDVTDRVRAERAVAERERLASLGVLAAGVAHEVNTPIAGLSSYAQMLLADTAPADPRYAILKKMERQTFRAAHLVNNLLEFARPRRSAPVRTDLRRIVENAAESVETTLGSRRLVLDLDGAAGPAWVQADPRELEQVFVNLFTNARDASPDEGELRCTLRQEGSTARVAIIDRGAGLPEGGSEKLFQPFYTSKKSGGTGLGLAISREIVRRHGGDIGLSPRPEGGVEAWVVLPLAGQPS